MTEEQPTTKKQQIVESDLEDGEVPESDNESQHSTSPIVEKSSSPIQKSIQSKDNNATTTTTSVGGLNAVNNDNGGGDNKKIEADDDVILVKYTDGGGSSKSKKKSKSKDKDKDKESASERSIRKRHNKSLKRQHSNDKHSDGRSKKSKIDLLEIAAEIDEYEMLCVRGASPPPAQLSSSQSLMMSSSSYPSYRGSGGGDGRYTSDEYDDGGSSGGGSSGGMDKDYYKLSKEERRSKRRQHSQKLRRKYTDGGGGGGGSGGNGSTNSNNNKQSNNKRQPTDGICMKHYFKGNCTDDLNCNRTHEYRQPKKLEICKFYLTGQCAKTVNCTYLHEDFPCKYYYLGVNDRHNKKKCMFMHGAPLNKEMQMALLKHIDKAPRSILGDFPKLFQQNATEMLKNHHKKLVAELLPNSITTNVVAANTNHIYENNEITNNKMMISNNDFDGRLNKNDLFELNDMGAAAVGDLDLINNRNIENNLNKSSKSKKSSSRWSTLSTQSPLSPLSYLETATETNQSIKSNNERVVDEIHSNSSLNQMLGIITPEQIKKLYQIGVKNVDEIDHLTVGQLNDIGLSIAQIHQIQINSLSMKNMTETKESSQIDTKTNTGDVDLRTLFHSNVGNVGAGSTGASIVSQDIDMRMLHPLEFPITTSSVFNELEKTNNNHFIVNKYNGDNKNNENVNDDNDNASKFVPENVNNVRRNDDKNVNNDGNVNDVDVNVNDNDDNDDNDDEDDDDDNDDDLSGDDDMRLVINDDFTESDNEKLAEQSSH